MMKIKKKNKKKIIITLISFLFLFLVYIFFLSSDVTKYESEVANALDAFGVGSEEAGQNTASEEIEKIKYVQTPEQVKAIYMTACVAATPSLRKNLVKLIEDTEINSIIIDIKDFSGTISFNSENQKLVGQNGTGCRVKDMKDFVKELHDKDIYTIARITVFQDPYYANLHPELAVKKKSDRTVWKDFKGISFIDVGAKNFWDYILEIAFESHKIGFDEINFDYVRFPSDGNMNDIYFEHSDEFIKNDEENGKALALEEFFKYLSSEIEKYNKDKEFKMITSADLFGMVTTNKDDLGIGQVLERALPYFDYIAPMVYPSHYPAGFNGYKNPNHVPYDLIFYVMKGGYDRVVDFKNATTTDPVVAEKLSHLQLRPWLQDFDYGGDYDVAEVKAQIKATYDVGLNSYMLWSPSNRYTKGALADSVADVENIPTVDNATSSSDIENTENTNNTESTDNPEN